MRIFRATVLNFHTIAVTLTETNATIPVLHELIKPLHADNIMILEFYDYEGCFRHYRESIADLNQNRLNGKVNIAKPALLLTVMQLIDQRWIRNNHIILTSEIEKLYSDLYHQYDPGSVVTQIYYSFCHLMGDGFWHIRWLEGEKKINSASRKFIDDNIDYVFLDDDLWILLQNPDWRHNLMDFVITEKMNADQPVYSPADLAVR